MRAWFLAEFVDRIPSGADVLELGCGPGVDAVVVADGRRYTGVDLSPVMLSLARERVPDGALMNADLTALDLPSGSFDAVVAIYVFGHIPGDEHAATFARVFRWLRPGGVFCSSFPAGAHEDMVQENFLGVPMFFGGIGRDATERLLRGAGFELELSEEKEEEEDGMTVRFHWVIASKPERANPRAGRGSFRRSPGAPPAGAGGTRR